ncbi:MAG: hypothetical protein QME58_04390 [Bacteroidota bacterium]|nr:hypothetical protein [Bacteroidota bacterium]
MKFIFAPISELTINYPAINLHITYAGGGQAGGLCVIIYSARG